MDNTEKTKPAGLLLSKRAIERIAEIRKQRSEPTLMLRITVEGGGCSGFQYKLDWDDKIQDEDRCFEECVVIDTMSLSYLAGSTVDFVSGMMGEDFKILNPNAVSSCGCGTSFSV
ncbi:MAG: iron-sulfur cluster assembly accessory protein [Alphaproteobacteria bacterium]|nr:iron-sulfur cluster assembly accessory protein [Alphaproteobacteria bacterium]